MHLVLNANLLKKKKFTSWVKESDFERNIFQQKKFVLFKKWKESKTHTDLLVGTSLLKCTNELVHIRISRTV